VKRSYEKYADLYNGCTMMYNKESFRGQRELSEFMEKIRSLRENCNFQEFKSERILRNRGVYYGKNS
jgi:thymidine kinase